MKNKTHYNVITIQNDTVNHHKPKTLKNTRKYLANGAQSVIKEWTNKKGWFQELIWSDDD